MSVRVELGERTRSALLDAAIERFAEHGPGTSFDVVAADVGVTKGALYHHFGSKDGLVEEVYKEAIRRHAARVMEASASGDGRTRLLALVDASARLYSSRTPFYRLLTTLTDPALYARGNGGQTRKPALSDAEAKKPGEPANVREAATPKPPTDDSSRRP